MRIGEDGVVRVILDDVVVAQHVREREVAVGVVELRVGDAGVNGKVAASKAGKVLVETRVAILDGGVNAVDELVDRNGAGVDERVDGTVVAAERELVEGFAGGLHAHDVTHSIESQLLERQRIDEGLGDGLNGKFMLRIARRVDVPGRRAQRHGELVWVGVGELRDVVSDLSPVLVAD